MIAHNLLRAAGVIAGGDHAVVWRWQKRLPSPLTRADVRAGYVYELAFRQFEISDTRVFDRPAAGRSFFEQLIRDHLDVGRPESVSLIFDRRISRRTPGTWRTWSSTKGRRSARSAATHWGPAARSRPSRSIGRRAPRRSSPTPVTSASACGSPRELESPTGGRRESQPASVRRASRQCPTRSRSRHLHPGDPTIADRRQTPPDCRSGTRG